MNDPAVDSARVTAQRARATLFALTGALLMFGLFFVLDSSSVTAQRLYGSPFTYFYRQVVWVGVGVIAMLIS
jgi:cell division protein FtsW (lipid II flippase)